MKICPAKLTIILGVFGIQAGNDVHKHHALYIQGGYTRTQPIRLFVLSTRHLPSPNALRAPGLVDVVHRERGGLWLPAGQ